MKFIAARRFNYIDVGSIAVSAISFSDGRYWTGFIVLLVGAIASVASEHWANK